MQAEIIWGNNCSLQFSEQSQCLRRQDIPCGLGSISRNHGSVVCPNCTARYKLLTSCDMTCSLQDAGPTFGLRTLHAADHNSVKARILVDHLPSLHIRVMLGLYRDWGYIGIMKIKWKLLGKLKWNHLPSLGAGSDEVSSMCFTDPP